MNLVDAVMTSAEDEFGVNWTDLYSTVSQHLRVQMGAEICDPRRYPTYWCVPVLVGSYVGASRCHVLGDLERFLAGCLARHFLFESHSPITDIGDDDVVALTRSAYDESRIDVVTQFGFEERFAVKCRPWTQLLALGTLNICEAADPTTYHNAMGAIVHVYSCLQIVDDWHDRGDDARRGHWNMWTGGDGRHTLGLIQPLLSDAYRCVGRLRPHLLRRALTAQLQDVAKELNDLSVLAGRSSGGSARDGGQRTKTPALRQDSEGRAAQYLESRLAADSGLWCDFAVPGISVGSTECISAYVATQLAQVPAGRRVARAVAGRLVACARTSGGWGYRSDVPEDCDSTAWVLLAAVGAKVAVPSGLLRHAQDFILEHQRPDGGFVTYGPSARRSLTPADQPGWFDSEVSVTSSAVLALWSSGMRNGARLASACDYIAAQTEDDLWVSYWWQGFGYGTYLACRALSVAGEGRYEGHLQAAADAVKLVRCSDGMWGVQGNASDVFTTSLALRTLLLIESTNKDSSGLRDAAEWLRERQSPEGAWPPGARMLAPGARDSGDVVLHDAGVVTTATAAAALHEMEVLGER